jgi:acetyltransferase EpsM
MRNLLIYGAGGHASVIADVVQSEGKYRLIGLLDDNPALVGSKRFGCVVLRNADVRFADETTQLFLGIGDNHSRYRIFATLPRRRFPVLVHPTAVIGRDVAIGDGTVVMPGAIVEHGATIGAHCIINNGAIVGHYSRVGDFCHVSGNSALGGEVTLGQFVFVGMGAVVTPRVTLQKNCLVSAGSVATRDFDEGATIIGNPGRPLFNRRDLG